MTFRLLRLAGLLCALLVAPMSTPARSAASGEAAQQHADLSVQGAQVAVVPEFCAARDLNGTTDNTACVQAALRAQCERGAAGTVRLPAGTYRWTSVDLCPGQWIRGEGHSYGNQGSSGTTIVCAGSRQACIRWNHGQRNYGDGGGLVDVGIDAAAQTAPVLEVTAMRNWLGARIAFYQPTTAWHVSGGDAVVLRDSHFEGVKALAGTEGLIDIDSIGGSACAGGNDAQSCRGDAVTLENLDGEMGVTQTGGACIAIHNFVATVNVRHTRLINCWDGLTTDCVAPGNLGGCPTFFQGFDVEFDFCQHLCASIVDTPEFWCTACYWHGSDHTPNVLTFGCVTYCGGPGQTAGGGNLTDNHIDGSRGSCVLLGVPGMILKGNRIWNCNGAGNAPGVRSAGIAVLSSPAQAPPDRGGGIIADNDFCRSEGQVPTLMDAIVLAGATTRMHVHDNEVSTCRTGVSGGTGGRNVIHDN